MSSFSDSIKVSKQQMKEQILEEINQMKDPYSICDYLVEKGNSLTRDCMSALEDAIARTRDILQIYEFLFLAADKKIDIDRKKFEGIIMESGNAKLMYYCLVFVPGTDIEKMLNALLDTKNAMYIEDLRSEECQEAIGDIKFLVENYKKKLAEAKDFTYFPRSLEQFGNFETPVEELKEKVKEKGEPYLITELANYLEYLKKYKNKDYSLDDLTTAILKCNDPMNLYEYISSVGAVKDKKPFIRAVNEQRKSRIKFLKYIKKYVELSPAEIDLITSCVGPDIVK